MTSKERDEYVLLLGEIKATQALILEELRDQKRKVEALQFKVYTWAGGLGVLVVIWPAISGKVLSVIGF